jgi:hypothetical protein
MPSIQAASATAVHEAATTIPLQQSASPAVLKEALALRCRR